MAVRNADARRTTIWVHHQSPSEPLFVGRAARPRPRQGFWHCEPYGAYNRTLLLRLLAFRDRRARSLLCDPLGAWIMESAMAPARIVQRSNLTREPLDPNDGAHADDRATITIPRKF